MRLHGEPPRVRDRIVQGMSDGDGSARGRSNRGWIDVLRPSLLFLETGQWQSRDV